MTKRRFFPLILLVTLLLAGIVPSILGARKIRLRMGTIVPRGSAWHEGLLYIRQEWRKISDGQVDLVIIPDGQLGDEGEMVRKMRSGIIQAVALSSTGLSRIDEGVSALQIPLMFESYDELDYVRERIAPKLEQRIESHGVGHKVLFWSDGGWVRLFTKQPAKTPEDVRQMKLFTSAGDPETERLWKSFGFNVVPLSPTDIVTALQTGMITAVDVPPIFAMLDRIYTEAPHMTDIKLAPLIGGAVISKKAWDRVPSEYRSKMLEVAAEAGARVRDDIRQLGPDSIEQMKKRGLTVVELDEQARASWEKEAKEAYPKLRGTYCPAPLFDEVQRLTEEYRRSK